MSPAAEFRKGWTHKRSNRHVCRVERGNTPIVRLHHIPCPPVRGDTAIWSILDDDRRGVSTERRGFLYLYSKIDEFGPRVGLGLGKPHAWGMWPSTFEGRVTHTHRLVMNSRAWPAPSVLWRLLSSVRRTNQPSNASPRLPFTRASPVTVQPKRRAIKTNECAKWTGSCAHGSTVSRRRCGWNWTLVPSAQSILTQNRGYDGGLFVERGVLDVSSDGQLVRAGGRPWGINRRRETSEDHESPGVSPERTAINTHTTCRRCLFCFRKTWRAYATRSRGKTSASSTCRRRWPRWRTRCRARRPTTDPAAWRWSTNSPCVTTTTVPLIAFESRWKY